MVYSSAPIRVAGQITGLVVVFRDVTERRLADRALRESEERLRKLNSKLIDKIRELEAFEQAVIGRELKMMELKKELEKRREAEGGGPGTPK